MILRRYLKAQLLRRPWRSGLTLAGIVIGVQSLVAIPMTIQSTRTAYRNLFEGLAGHATLEIVAHGDGGFDGALAEPLRRVPAVVAAVPMVRTAAALLLPSGPIPVLLVGLHAAEGGAAPALDLVHGTMPTAPDDIAVPAALVADSGAAIGDPLTIMTARGPQRWTICGLTRPRALSAGTVVVVDLAAAQAAFGFGTAVNVVQLQTAPNADLDGVQAAVTAQLPRGLSVQEPAERARLIGTSFSTTEQLLSTLSVVALATGAFVILNTFLMDLNERRRELAMLRALGATRRQVTRQVVCEAAVLGTAGSLIGAPLGVAMATVMMAFMEQLMVTALPAPQWSWPTVITALLAGPVVAVLSVLVPARQSAGQAPLVGLHDAPPAAPDRTPRWLRITVPILLALALGGILVVIYGPLPKWVFVFLLPALTVLLVIALAAAIPLTVPWLARIIGNACTRRLGVEGLLAARTVRRHPTRTALVTTVLALAVLVSLAFGNSILLSLDDLDTWCDEVIASDFLVRGHAQEPSTLMTAPLPSALRDTLAALPDVERVEPLRFLPAEAGGQRIILLACGWGPGAGLGLDVFRGDRATLVDQLRGGAVAIGTLLSQKTGRGVGDTLTLQTRHGPRDVRIAAVVTEYTAAGLAMYVEWNTAAEWMGAGAPQVLMIDVVDGREAPAGTALQAVCDTEHVVLQSRTAFRVTLDEMIAGITAMFWVLMGLVFVVASLGITNALTMNVIEQTHELGILRAVAMERRRLGRMVLAQALTLGLISVPPGVILGVVLSVILVISTYPITAIPIGYDLSIALLIGCPLIALGITLLAALPPLRRATRLDITEALRTE